jgi:hypothetical protein
LTSSSKPINCFIVLTWKYIASNVVIFLFDLYLINCQVSSNHQKLHKCGYDKPSYRHWEMNTIMQLLFYFILTFSIEKCNFIFYGLVKKFGYSHLNKFLVCRGPSWSYGCWIYNNLWNQTSVSITSLNPAHGGVYLIQHYLIKLVEGFLCFPPSIKLTDTI